MKPPQIDYVELRRIAYHVARGNGYSHEHADEIAQAHCIRAFSKGSPEIEHAFSTVDFLRSEANVQTKKGKAKRDALHFGLETWDAVDHNSAEKLLENEPLKVRDLDPHRFWRNHRFYRPRFLIGLVLPEPPKPIRLSWIRCDVCYRLVWTHCFWC